MRTRGTTKLGEAGLNGVSSSVSLLLVRLCNGLAKTPQGPSLPLQFGEDRSEGRERLLLLEFFSAAISDTIKCR